MTPIHASIAVLALASVASADRYPIGRGDLGSTTAESMPDGTDDVIWLDDATGEVWVQFLSPTGISVIRLRDVADRSATPILGPGAIASVAILDGGDGYQVTEGTADLVIDHSGSGGSGMAGSFNVTGSVVEINVVDGGSGYHDDGVGFFVVDDTGTGGSGLDFLYLTLPGDTDSVQTVKILEAGAGYEPGAELAVLNANFLDETAFDEPMAGIAHVGADGTIIQVDLVESGSGFLETPELTLLGASQGGGAVFQAFMGGSIHDILPNPGNFDPGGSGYAADPLITPETAGTGFEYEMVREGTISQINLTSGGSGYQVPPTVDGAEGANAQLEAELFESQNIWPAGQVPARTSIARVFSNTGLPVTVPGRASQWEAHAGDFDGDGDGDLMLRSKADSTASRLLLLEGGMVARDESIAAPEEGWRLAAAQDLDGVAGDELLWCDPHSQQSVIWSIDPDEADLIGAGSGELVQPLLGSGYQVCEVLQSADGGARLVWFNGGSDTWATTQLTAGDATSVAELGWFASSTGALWMPSDDSYAIGAGDWDGDGVADDLLVCRGDGRQKGMLQIWRTEDGVIQSDDIVTWQSLTMTAPLGRHGRMVRNDAQDSTIALRSYDRLILYNLPSLGTVTAVPEGTLDDLIQTTADLALLEGQEETVITDAIDALVDAAGDIDGASEHLDSQHVRSTLLAGLPIAIQLEADAALVEAFGDRQSGSTSTSTAVSVAYSLDADGNAHVVMPSVLNRHYDYLYPGNVYQYGGPDGNSGSNSGSSGSTSGESGGSTGGSDGGTGTGGTGSTGGGGSSGTGLPDNFDPNDESTWPEGVDTFEELLEFLQNLEI